MKIAVIADAHLNRSLYKGVMDRELTDIPFRSADFMKSFEWMIDQIINEIKPDLLEITGDVFDHYDPSNDARGFLNSQIKKLRDVKIPTIILVGNHDVCRKHHALKPLKELGLNNPKIIDEPTLLSFQGVNLMLFPYSLSIEQQKISIKDEFTKFLELSKDKLSQDGFKNKDTFFFGHFGVRGATITQYKKEEKNDFFEDEDGDDVIVVKDFINRTSSDISIWDLDKIGAQYVFLGDYHSFQVLPTKKCVAMYTGSIEKTNITEMEQDKGFVVYDSESESIPPLGKCKFIKYPACRPMIELKGTINEMNLQYSTLDVNAHQNAIIKLSFDGDKKELKNFSNGIDLLKKKLETTINPIYIYHQQNVEDVEEQEEATKLELEIEKKGHVETEDVFDTVQDMIREAESDPTEQQALIDLAKDIKETVEGK